jgi:hypothetical protein
MSPSQPLNWFPLITDLTHSLNANLKQNMQSYNPTTKVILFLQYLQKEWDPIVKHCLVVEPTPQIASTSNATHCIVRRKRFGVACYSVVGAAVSARAQETILCVISRVYKILHKMCLCSLNWIIKWRLIDPFAGHSCLDQVRFNFRTSGISIFINNLISTISTLILKEYASFLSKFNH